MALCIEPSEDDCNVSCDTTSTRTADRPRAGPRQERTSRSPGIRIHTCCLICCIQHQCQPVRWHRQQASLKLAQKASRRGKPQPPGVSAYQCTVTVPAFQRTRNHQGAASPSHSVCQSTSTLAYRHTSAPADYEPQYTRRRRTRAPYHLPHPRCTGRQGHQW